ncbi:competence protein ComGA [Macrococcus sp. IME1552]|nr:competence type IV pilus ATPase ComGA [Macrococcus sp. IME1552]ATD30214.1 competence protein ComGA [Macrococcus sp. IME1552]
MEKLLHTILDDAIAKKTSDVHFIPEVKNVMMKFRIGGNMYAYNQLNTEDFEKLLSYVKFITHLDVSEKNKAQSGILTYQKDKILYNIRASTLPHTIGQEACVMRIIPALFSQNVSIEQELLTLMHKGSGLILISGPTGSGKSTLMYQMLNYAAQNLNKQIISIEDPVEQRIHGMIQINVNRKANITYQNTIKAILRCDPDIIMIGEIRDIETAKHVINASLSGHLVLSTLHANTCLGAIHRLLEMGITKVELEQCVEIIINQRLVNTTSARTRIFEQLIKGDVRDYLNDKKVQHYHPLSEQLQILYDKEKITQLEYERYALE